MSTITPHGDPTTTTMTPKRRYPKGPARDAVAAELAHRYEDGLSIRALVAETGRSYGFIHKILTECGVNLRCRGGQSRKTSDRVFYEGQPLS